MLERFKGGVDRRLTKGVEEKIEKVKDFGIRNVVPGEVVKVTGNFTEGLAELGKNHKILGITGIQYSVGFSSETSSLLVIIEPRETQQT